MDKINELKKLKEHIENLRQKKLDNKKTIEEIKNEENSIEKLERNIQGLRFSKFDIRMAKFCKITSLVFLIYGFVSLISGISLGRMGNLLHFIVGWVMGVAVFAGFSCILKEKCLKEYGCSSIKEINNQIEEKEKQKELIKSKSETNKEILIEKEKRQIELDEEIKKCATELSKYEAVKDGIVNEFLNSPEFLQKLNNQMLENEEIAQEEKGISYQKRNNH